MLVIKIKYIRYIIDFPNANEGRDQALGKTALLKTIIKISFATVSFVSRPLAKKLKASQAGNGQCVGGTLIQAVLILREKVRVLGVPRTPGI